MLHRPRIAGLRRSAVVLPLQNGGGELATERRRFRQKSNCAKYEGWKRRRGEKKRTNVSARSRGDVTSSEKRQFWRSNSGKYMRHLRGERKRHWSSNYGKKRNGASGSGKSVRLRPLWMK